MSSSHRARRAEPERTAAILVAHHGARWLPQTLQSIDALAYRPHELLIVHDGSDSATTDLLSQRDDRVLTVPGGSSFADHVAAAVKASDSDWLWLLHDDAAVEPATLAALLDEAALHPGSAVIGPKVREWPSLRRLVEVGLTISSSADRETGLESGEPDAGQHDRSREVLAVGTAGMLVRRSVYDEVGGFDTQLPHHRVDLDFCWRVNAAGHRVRVCPQGVVFHAEASERGRRKDAPSAAVSRAADVRTVLMNVPGRVFIWSWLRLALACLGRIIVSALFKDWEGMRAEARTLVSVHGRPDRLFASRRARRSSRAHEYRRIKGMRPPWWLPWQHAADSAATAMGAMSQSSLIGQEGLRTIDQPEPRPDDEELAEPKSFIATHTWLWAVVSLAILALIAGRALVGQIPFGGALPRAAESVGQWWQLALGLLPAAGLPSSDWPTAVAAPLAATGSVTWFSPGLPIAVVMIGAAPLAALTMHRLVRVLGGARNASILAAIVYGLSVLAVGAVQEGRIGTVVAMICTPVVVNVTIRLAMGAPWSIAAFLALVAALAGAFAPGIVLVFVLLWLGAAIGWRAGAIKLAVAAAATFVLLTPTWVHLVAEPRRIFAQAGFDVDDRVALWRVLTGVTHGPAWLSVAGGAVIVLAAALTVASLKFRPKLVVGFWAIGLAGLAFAVLSRSVDLGGGVHATPSLGAGLWLMAGCAVVAISAERSQLLSTAAIAVLGPVAIVLAAWWVVVGSDDPLSTSPPSPIPAYLAKQDVLTLVLDDDGDADVSVRQVAGRGPVLGQEALRPDADRVSRVEDLTARMLASPDTAAVSELAGLGFGAVYQAQATESVTSVLDVTEGLERAGSDSPSARVWQIPDPSPVEHTTSTARTAVLSAWLVAWLGVGFAAIPRRERRKR